MGFSSSKPEKIRNSFLIYLIFLKKKPGSKKLWKLFSKIPLMILKYEVGPNLIFQVTNYHIVKFDKKLSLCFNTVTQEIAEKYNEILQIDSNLSFVQNINEHSVAITGGFEDERLVFIKDRLSEDAKKNQFKFKMQKPRGMHRCFFNKSLSDRMFIIGGSSIESQNLKFCECFCFYNDNFGWSRMAELIMPTKSFGISSNNKEIFVFGGLTQNLKLDIIQIYNPALNL